MKKLHIKKGDTVYVNAGNDKGKTGKVLSVDPKADRAVVEGINMVSKHTKPNSKQPQGGIVKQEAPIHISNLNLLDPKTNTPTRVGIRMDGDKSSMKTEPVDMSALTVEVIRMLTPAAEKRGQRLESSITPGVHMMGDRARLNQILYNLTDNAIKYSPDGGRIAVVLQKEDEGIVWRVRDNGVGIPEEDQEHIFERFYRVDKARSRETGGTGLGLSIVKQLVTMHGGEITVHSEPNHGSEFRVVFSQGGAAG